MFADEGIRLAETFQASSSSKYPRLGEFGDKYGENPPTNLPQIKYIMLYFKFHNFQSVIK